MVKAQGFLKRHSFALFCIVVGCFVFFWVRNYPEVPSGIGPAFFPKVIASMLVGLSIVCIAVNWDKDLKGEVSPDKLAIRKIVFTSVLFVIATLLMEHVHVMVGIFLFLVAYIKVIAQEKWVKTIMISGIGSVAMFFAVEALRIPM